MDEPTHIIETEDAPYCTHCWKKTGVPARCMSDKSGYGWHGDHRYECPHCKRRQTKLVTYRDHVFTRGGV